MTDGLGLQVGSGTVRLLSSADDRVVTSPARSPDTGTRGHGGRAGARRGGTYGNEVARPEVMRRTSTAGVVWPTVATLAA